MDLQIDADLTALVGKIPYRIALAGGWIDQPFVSKLNPSPPGSMVVVGVEPTFRFMDRSGMATSTREVARKLWSNTLPDRDPQELVRELYAAENRGKPEPSGSQDMVGLSADWTMTLGRKRDFSLRILNPTSTLVSRTGWKE